MKVRAQLFDKGNYIGDLDVEVDCASQSDLAQRITRLVLKHGDDYFLYYWDNLPSPHPSAHFKKGILICV